MKSFVACRSIDQNSCQNSFKIVSKIATGTTRGGTSRFRATAMPRPQPQRCHAALPLKIGTACPSLEKKSDIFEVFGRFGHFEGFRRLFGHFRVSSNVFERFSTFPGGGPVAILAQ